MTSTTLDNYILSVLQKYFDEDENSLDKRKKYILNIYKNKLITDKSYMKDSESNPTYIGLMLLSQKKKNNPNQIQIPNKYKNKKFEINLENTNKKLDEILYVYIKKELSGYKHESNIKYINNYNIDIPETGYKCKLCDSFIIIKTVQTRSSDEPETVKIVCENNPNHIFSPEEYN